MKTRGKRTCRILKEIRQQIAAANDIELVTSECRYKGDCPGTCPKCEAEVRYLEQQLRARSSAGKAIALAGISAASLSMLMPGAVTAQTPQALDNNITNENTLALATRELKGIVFGSDTISADSIRTEPLIGAIIVNNTRHQGAATNIDGEFSIPVTTGDSLTISYIGFNSKDFIVTEDMKDLYVTLESLAWLDDTGEVIAGYVPMPKSSQKHYTELNIIDRNGNPINPDSITIDRVLINAKGTEIKKNVLFASNKKYPIRLFWDMQGGGLRDRDGIPLKAATLRIKADGYADPILIKLHYPERPVKHTVIFPAMKDKDSK